VSKKNVNFILVPDRAAARKIRRVIAGDYSRENLVVGTWVELETLALNAYLIPPIEDDWLREVDLAASSMPTAFWNGSFQVAREQTVQSIAGALEALLEGMGPTEVFGPHDFSVQFEGRVRRHIDELFQLFSNLKEALPKNLEAIRALLKAPVKESIHLVSVAHIEDFPHLNPWQNALIEKLNVDSGKNPETDNQVIFENLLKLTTTSGEQCALSFVQQHLFSKEKSKRRLDRTIQWVGVRDYLEEVEIVAGMIQQALADNPDLKASQIAILIPTDTKYYQSLLDVFTHAGLALSGLPVERHLRDLGREVVLDFLQMQAGPAPIMALASFLSSPLMPWKPQVGFKLSQKVMSGDFKFKIEDGSSMESQAMIELVKSSGKFGSDVEKALRKFSSLLSEENGREFHVQRARIAVEDVIDALSESEGTISPDIYSRASPEVINDAQEPDINREGIPVFLESEEPWRDVDHLYVLGFSEGNYPQAPSLSAVFTEQDLSSIRDSGKFSIELGSEKTNIRRQQFRRQLCAARKSVTVLIPRKDEAGSKQAASESLTFMAKLFDEANDPQKIILDIDNKQSRDLIKGLALREKLLVSPPKEFEVKTLEFNRDLFSLRKDDEGNDPAVSPSRFEKMLVSPLAWLLSDLRIEPIPWAPEEMDAMVQGTLAHAVFEDLFMPEVDLPSEEDIRGGVDKHLTKAIRMRMPLLQTAAWHVEKNKLEHDIIEAALQWRKMILAFDARILDNEAHLRGSFSKLPIHGYVDTVIALPDGRLYVVDFKKSKSDGRLYQMEKGYDSQASLYRTMLETGTDEEISSDAIKAGLASGCKIGVLYFMMNDAIGLTDSADWGHGNIAGLREVENDVSDKALALIKERIKFLRKGTVELNHENDVERFKKETGLKAYALADSPLISLFMHDAESDEGGLI
jgi:ATP-dependent helicase/nuclease subunit B